MAWQALVAGGASLLSGFMSSRAANNATDAQVEASEDSIKEQRRQFDLTREDFQPFRDAGYNALAGYNYELGMGEKPSGYSGFEQSPGYLYQLEQGNQAIANSSAARGMRLSGDTMLDFQEHAMGLANQDYGNYLGRFAGLVDVGSGSTSAVASYGANTANNISNAYSNIGTAQAEGYMNQNAAFSNTLNNLASVGGMYQGGYFG